MSEVEKVNILLVDDQPARLLSYEAILGGLGQNLVHAASGTEALDRLMKAEFAVILLDVSMPGMDGFETAEMIHRHPRFERTPIIFVTALHVTDMDRLRGYELGAVDYVYVPVVPQILRSKVQVLVELHCKRRELQRMNADLARANTTLQAEQTRALQGLNRTLEAANAELARANATLHAEVSARKRLEQALREADRRKDAFLATLAHELRNPLAPIANAVELLRRSPITDPDVVWCRQVLQRQVEQLARLVADLLDVSRITQGKIKLERAAICVQEIVALAVETMRPTIDAGEHRLTIDVPDQSLQVDGDLTRLAQVVGNLLSNAAKYTARGGAIRLFVEGQPAQDDRPESVAIGVTDTGVGIAPAMLSRIFELFTQAEQTRDRAQGGLGIGLALVRQLVEMHGGSVSVFSAGEDRGSEFRIVLPLLKDLLRVAPGDGASEATATATAQRILVADDSEDSAASLTLLLKTAGNHVESAHDGVAAVELAERFRPDIVLLDLGMPRLDGYGAARRIRALPHGEAMLLVAITGWGQSESREQTREAGFDAHLVKPINFDSLIQLLSDLRQKKTDGPQDRLDPGWRD
jgi:signal transduction histidine kinase